MAMESAVSGLCGCTIVHHTRPTLAADSYGEPAGQSTMFRVTTKRGYSVMAAKKVLFKTGDTYTSLDSLVPGKSRVQLAGSMLPRWGVTDPVAYDGGYLVGRLASYGHFRGFYPTPTLLVHRNEPNTREKVAKIISAARTIHTSSQLIPHPTVLEYAGGSFGVECSILDAYAEPYMTPIERLPMFPIELAAKRFQRGFLRAVFESCGEFGDTYYDLNWNRPEWLEIVQRMLLRFCIGSERKEAAGRHYLHLMGKNLITLGESIGTDHEAALLSLKGRKLNNETFTDEVATVQEIGVRAGYKCPTGDPVNANGILLFTL